MSECGTQSNRPHPARARRQDLDLEAPQRLAKIHRRAEQAGVVDIGAQDFLLRGWALYYRPASSPVRQAALQAFERALELDPESIDGRIGIGTVLADDLVPSFSNSREQDIARADQVLSEALERALNRSMAHFAMGVLRRVQNRLSDSKIELETAIALDRNNARASSNSA